MGKKGSICILRAFKNANKIKYIFIEPREQRKRALFPRLLFPQ